MLTIIASGLIFTEIKISVLRMLSDIVRKFWSKWMLRLMVLSSLFLQFFLIKFGKQRKHRASSMLAFLVWSTYLLADWMATVSLSTLLNGQEESINELAVFWAPILLFHLGGPDSITAYALEDNELWLRYLLGLFLQVGAAFYVSLRFQTNVALTFLAIPIFIAGVIKYGERIWILKSASTRQVRNSVFLAPEPKPPTKDSNGSPSPELEDLDTYLISNKNRIPGAKSLREASILFKMFKPLFSEITLRFYEDLFNIFTFKPSKSSSDAFKLVETELGFLYDVLYTKTTILISPKGLILRFICFLSSLSALVAFLFVISKHPYPKVDIAITYMLLVGAAFFDIYAVITHVLSDWTLLWLTYPNNKLPISVYWAISSLSVLNKCKKQSRTMGQHNLIRFCLKDKPVIFVGVAKLLDMYHIVGKFYSTRVDVEIGLKDLIYSHILEKRERYKEKGYDTGFLKELLSKRGDDVLERRSILSDFLWCTIDVEFDHSLLLWHIATDLCYLDDLRKSNGEDILGSNCKMSRSLSDYMLYLLLVRPFMMPKGISEVRHRDTYVQTQRFFGKVDQPLIEACQALLEFNFDSLPVFPESGRSKSVLLLGIQLAKRLQCLVTEKRWDHEEKWEMISELWVEMLIYAASHCGWKEHCQQLGQGGELLTHVCLLMAHHVLSPQIRIVEFPEFLHDLSYKAIWNWDQLDSMAYYLA